MDEKHKLLGNFEKFSKSFLRKFRKIHYFSIVFENFNKPCVNVSRVWTKTTNCLKTLEIFDENSIEKLNFYLFFGKVVEKIEISEITSFFYNIFSGSGGVNPSNPPPPEYATVPIRRLKKQCKIYQSQSEERI